ncbi:MAG: histidine kinase dimerization/phospho-acceptor domain-containing protein [Dehalococcoidia bacterium]
MNGRRGEATSLASNGERDLEEQVSRLARRLKRTERQQTALSAAVSHELRAPLASLRAMVEALADGVVEDPDDVRRYYAGILCEIARLDRLLDDLSMVMRLGADVRDVAVRSDQPSARPASASSR